MTSAPCGTPKAFGLSTITWITRTRIPLLVVPEHGGTPPPLQVCSLRMTEPIPGNAVAWPESNDFLCETVLFFWAILEKMRNRCLRRLPLRLLHCVGCRPICSCLDLSLSSELLAKPTALYPTG